MVEPRANYDPLSGAIVDGDNTSVVTLHDALELCFGKAARRRCGKKGGGHQAVMHAYVTV